MLYVTGDTHIPIDIKKLNQSNFPEQSGLSKKDFVLICGDFGALWDNSNEELYWRKWLLEMNFTTLFIDGNHENFDLLNNYPINEWNGGKVHFINESIIHLLRGQVYTFDGLKIFTLGGAESIDKYRRIEGKTWWKEEMPTNSEFNEALNNLDNHNWTVDYVITHTAPSCIIDQIYYHTENNPLNGFLNMLYDNLNYKHWFFGHFHNDINFDNKHTLLYQKIVKLK